MFLVRFIRGLIALIVIGPTVICLNIIQASTVVLLPFSPILGRKINLWCCWAWFELLQIALQNVVGIQMIHTGDPTRDENAFVIANHQAMVDIPALLSVARKAGYMQHTKWFVKYNLRYSPGVGWGMNFLDYIFVKRNWAADRERVLATFSNIRKSPFPFWIVSFLEGTRATASKIKRSQTFAKKNNLPVLEHVMLPRAKGFTATMEGIEGRIAAIYDFTIAYEEIPAPNLLKVFFGKVKRIHIHVKRFDAGDVPTSEEARSQWVLSRFLEKEERLKKFRKDFYLS